MSLLASLPAPRHVAADLREEEEEKKSNEIHAKRFEETKHIPPYGRRKGFVPRKQRDFGGGGAFPEIHVAQYPLDMGRPDAAEGKSRSKADQTLALTVNAEGDVNYDAIVSGGGNKNKWHCHWTQGNRPKAGQVEPGHRKTR